MRTLERHKHVHLPTNGGKAEINRRFKKMRKIASALLTGAAGGCYDSGPFSASLNQRPDRAFLLSRVRAAPSSFGLFARTRGEN